MNQIKTPKEQQQQQQHNISNSVRRKEIQMEREGERKKKNYLQIAKRAVYMLKW